MESTFTEVVVYDDSNNNKSIKNNINDNNTNINNTNSTNSNTTNTNTLTKTLIKHITKI